MDAEVLEPATTPWHLWVIGVVSLLWNAMGGFDFLMTVSRNEAYLSQFAAEQRAYFESFPAYAVTSWGLAIATSIAGSVLLLLRRRVAGASFGLSLVAIAATTFHNWVIDYANAIKIMSSFGLIFSFVIIAVAILLWIYARRMAGRGILR